MMNYNDDDDIGEDHDEDDNDNEYNKTNYTFRILQKKHIVVCTMPVFHNDYCSAHVKSVVIFKLANRQE